MSLKKVRDIQRRKVNKALSSWSGQHGDELLRGDDEIYYFYKSVALSEWFVNYFGHIIIRFQRGGKSSTWSKYSYMSEHIVFKLPKRSLRKSYLLQMLAYALQREGRNYHGKEFCAFYLFFLKKVLGDAACAEMINHFVDQKVHFRPNPEVFSVEDQLVTMKVVARLKGKPHLLAT